MIKIETEKYDIELGDVVNSSLKDVLSAYSNSKKIVVVDENTQEHCLTKLITNFEELSQAEVLQLPSGEDNKQLPIVLNVWEVLSEYEFSRHDLVINLGGGMITDIGGFIASCYKRGVSFINIPTSLLGMVDASIGGKTGVNLGDFKNQIGVFNNAKAVYIDSSFLQTLPEDQLLSGFAEMIKHGLINSEVHYTNVIDQLKNPWSISDELISDSLRIKHEIVSKDPLEKGERKLLNFGHTIGHAIEGVNIGKEGYSHGYCVAIGMVIESYISLQKNLLPKEQYDRVAYQIQEFFPMPQFESEEIDKIVGLLINDKKNKEGKILCCLLSEIGKAVYDQEVTQKEFREAIEYVNC